MNQAKIDVDFQLGMNERVKTPGVGGLPYKKGGDACQEISIVLLKGTSLGVA